MLPIEIIIPFMLASALLALSPGPDNIFVLTQSALNGRIVGVMITLGLCTGLFVHTAAVAFGIAAIFQHSAVAFTALKITGALYLLYLAWQAFNASRQSLSFQQGQSRISLAKYYRRGIIMNITNPKVSIFFLAFLPQFASIDKGPLLPQIIGLGGLFIIVALVVFTAIALLAGTLGRMLQQSSKVQNIMNKLAGIVFTGLAIKLLLVEQN